MLPDGRAVQDAVVNDGIADALSGGAVVLEMSSSSPRDTPELGFRTGPLGSGHAMKALNNFCAAAGYVALAEALVLGRSFGLTPSTMV